MPNGRRRRRGGGGQQAPAAQPAAAPAGAAAAAAGAQPAAATGDQAGEQQEQRGPERGEARPRRQETGTQTTFWSVIDDHWDKLEKWLPWLAGIGAVIVTVRERAGRRMIRAAFRAIGDFLGGKRRQLQVWGLEVANFIHNPNGPVGSVFRWWTARMQAFQNRAQQRLDAGRQRRAAYFQRPVWHPARILNFWRY